MQLVRSWVWRLGAAVQTCCEHPRARRARGLVPGSALCAVIALAASQVASLQGGPPFLYALLLGLAFHHLGADAAIRPGIDFCAQTLLRLGVGLLGARITVAQIEALGAGTAAAVALAALSTIAFGVWAGRRLGLNRAQAVLTGGAVAICGASAALAIAAVLPRHKLGEQFTLMVVVVVTVLSTAAMVLYPLLPPALGLSPEMAGLFIGGSIHDVAQVVGAGYTLGQDTGDSAVLVKLFRVALLVLVVLVVSALFRAETRRDPSAALDARSRKRPALVPGFLWAFVALIALNSVGAVPASLRDALADVSRAALIVAIAALGTKTSFRQLARVGWRPLAALLLETLWLGAWVLAAAWFMPR